MNNIIGIAGRMNSGKGALANWLNKEYGYVILESAGKMKETCVDVLGLEDIKQLNELKKSNKPIGMYFNDEVCERFANAFNIEDIHFKNKMLNQDILTMRELLQKIGTDVLRSYNPDWHINQLCLNIIENVRNGNSVVIGDVRFPNEKARIEGLGGIVYYIERDLEINEHSSENSLTKDDFNEDQIIYNNDTVESLIEKFKVKMLQ